MAAAITTNTAIEFSVSSEKNSKRRSRSEKGNMNDSVSTAFGFEQSMAKSATQSSLMALV